MRGKEKGRSIEAPMSTAQERRLTHNAGILAMLKVDSWSMVYGPEDLLQRRCVCANTPEHRLVPGYGALATNRSTSNTNWLCWWMPSFANRFLR